jgi:hypothetical protein
MDRVIPLEEVKLLIVMAADTGAGGRAGGLAVRASAEANRHRCESDKSENTHDSDVTSFFASCYGEARI